MVIINICIIFFLNLGALMNAFSNQKSVYKYGYVPLTFPRDPVTVNQFAEHILLGQILEPLIETDQFGEISPGIAKNWSFSKDGNTIDFDLDKTKKFSNGLPVKASDVKYTLQRIIDKKSQTSNFLSNIKEIKIINDYKISIILSEPNVSILKALSRDQAGILPENWNFVESSNEPIVGSGAYRLIKENKKWYLVINKKNNKSDTVHIKKWELIYFLDNLQSIPTEIIPDFAPCVNDSIKEFINKMPKSENNLKTFEQISFAQTSAWWHPSGQNFTNLKIKLKTMDFIEYLFYKFSNDSNISRSTGIIPKGVAGHLQKSSFVVTKISKKLKKDKKQKIKIVYSGAMYNEFLKNIDLQKIAEEFELEVELNKIEISQLQKISDYKPDVVLSAWAGGFNDPEGFIALLSGFLGKEFKNYISPDLLNLYSEARGEQNWSKRSILFQNLNKRLHLDRYMAPGWSIPLYNIVNTSVIFQDNISFRYTPRLYLIKEIN